MKSKKQFDDLIDKLNASDTSLSISPVVPKPKRDPIVLD